MILWEFFWVAESQNIQLFSITKNTQKFITFETQTNIFDHSRVVNSTIKVFYVYYYFSSSPEETIIGKLAYIYHTHHILFTGASSHESYWAFPKCLRTKKNLSLDCCISCIKDTFIQSAVGRYMSTKCSHNLIVVIEPVIIRAAAINLINQIKIWAHLYHLWQSVIWEYILLLHPPNLPADAGNRVPCRVSGKHVNIPILQSS